MSDVDDAFSDLHAEAFSALGKAAKWQGIDCLVRRSNPDEPESFGRGRAVVATVLLKVRASEIAAPADGDSVVFTESGETYTIIAQPQERHRRRGVWTCEAEIQA